MTAFPSTRADDERLLNLLAARTRGATTPYLSHTTGMTDSAIRTATNRVLAADMRESDEPAGDVLRRQQVSREALAR